MNYSMKLLVALALPVSGLFAMQPERPIPLVQFQQPNDLLSIIRQEMRSGPNSSQGMISSLSKNELQVLLDEIYSLFGNPQKREICVKKLQILDASFVLKLQQLLPKLEAAIKTKVSEIKVPHQDLEVYFNDFLKCEITTPGQMTQDYYDGIRRDLLEDFRIRVAERIMVLRPGDSLAALTSMREKVLTALYIQQKNRAPVAPVFKNEDDELQRALEASRIEHERMQKSREEENQRKQRDEDFRVQEQRKNKREAVQMQFSNHCSEIVTLWIPKNEDSFRKPVELMNLEDSEVIIPFANINQWFVPQITVFTSAGKFNIGYDQNGAFLIKMDAKDKAKYDLIQEKIIGNLLILINPDGSVKLVQKPN